MIFIRFFAVFVVFVSVVCISSPVRADSTFLNYLFPSIFGPPEQGPKPQDTLRAPFAAGGEVKPLSEAEKKSLSSPENLMPVDQPHRPEKYVSQWTAEAVTDALTFDYVEADKHFKNLGTTFTPGGLQDFQGYLATTQILPNMKAQGLKMAAFIKDVPEPMNEGNFGGVYRWLYDVSVNVTLMPSLMNSYDRKGGSAVSSQTITVRIQVGRTQAPGFADGIAIERWTVLGAS